MYDESQKEFERLKWDYWNKSTIFNTFWRYCRSIGIDKEINIPYPFQPVTDALNIKIKHPILSDTMDYIPYFLYREPEHASFDEFWAETMFLRCAAAANEKSTKRVEDYRQIIASDIDSAVRNLRMLMKREPTIDELKDYFVNVQMKSYDTTYYMITQMNFTVAEAQARGKEVARILKKRITINKPEIKALRQYLTALNLKDGGATNMEIFNKLIGTEHYQDKERRARKLVSNARSIIANLELGKEPWWCLNGRYTSKSLYSVITEGGQITALNQFIRTD